MSRLVDSRFAPDCKVIVDGEVVTALSRESVVSALIAAGRPLIGRSSKYHRPRGAFCLAGSCASCLVRIDGRPNVRACMTVCRDGLTVETQNAVGSAAHDLLGAIDFVAPEGIDHHHLATWNALANRIAVGASRHLAGLGRLPDRVPDSWPEAREEAFDAVVVGAGPAGLGAVESLAAKGRRVLLVERERLVGGRLRCGLNEPNDPPLSWARDVQGAAKAVGGEVWTGTAVVGIWPDRDGWQVAAVEGEERLRLGRAPRLVLASGTWALPAVFEGNDLPGIFAARGLAVALNENGVVPGERAAVLGAGAEAEAVARMFSTAGMTVERILGSVVKAHGRLRLTALDLEGGRTIECDTLAVATARAPASELARLAGARLALDPEVGAWWVRPGESGEIVSGAFAAGELTGPMSASEAAEAGRRAGKAASHG